MSSLAAVPAHIPAHLVVDFDAFDGGRFGEDPWTRLAAIHDGPDVFFTPRNGGHWVVIGEGAARAIVARPDLFSANLPKFDRTVQEAMPYVVPLHADPPDHTMFRKILAPLFSSSAVREREVRVRAVARRLIAPVAARGECDFAREIAQRFQLAVFLQMVGVDEARAAELLSWVDAIVRPVDKESFTRASHSLVAFLIEVISARRAEPGDDIVSYLLAADYNGNPADDGTVLSICGNLFVGGLDTVTATSSFIMLFLGRRPELRALLRAEPRPWRAAIIEELIRRNGTVTNARAVVRDVDFDGVPFRAGDRIDLMYQLMGTDPERTPEPLAVSFERPNLANVIFGTGAHRCVGVHLARLELQVLLEEWLAMVPDFDVRADGPLPVRAGAVWAPLSVPLGWSA